MCKLWKFGIGLFSLNVVISLTPGFSQVNKDTIRFGTVSAVYSETVKTVIVLSTCLSTDLTGGVNEKSSRQNKPYTKS
jgi:hypothetical protein